MNYGRPQLIIDLALIQLGSSSSMASSSAPRTVIVERAMPRHGAKCPRELVESSTHESSADDAENIYGTSSTAVSALITDLRLEFDTLPKAPEGIVMAGVNPGQVVNLGHMFSMWDTLILRTFDVLESHVMCLEALLANSSSRQAEELLPCSSKDTSNHKRMHVATVALSQGFEDGLKVHTIRRL